MPGEASECTLKPRFERDLLDVQFKGGAGGCGKQHAALQRLIAEFAWKTGKERSHLSPVCAVSFAIGSIACVRDGIGVPSAFSDSSRFQICLLQPLRRSRSLDEVVSGEC